MTKLTTPAFVILGAAATGIGLGLAPSFGLSIGNASPPAYNSTVTNCRVVDGDTLHCDSGRVRLLGIDAPELPGHCARGRDCAPGDPYESSRSLGSGMGDGLSLKIENVGTDRYGRTLAMVQGARGDLSCWQLAHGEAIYKPKWDDGGLVAASCPSEAR